MIGPRIAGTLGGSARGREGPTVACGTSHLVIASVFTREELCKISGCWRPTGARHQSCSFEPDRSGPATAEGLPAPLIPEPMDLGRDS